MTPLEFYPIPALRAEYRKVCFRPASRPFQAASVPGRTLRWRDPADDRRRTMNEAQEHAERLNFIWSVKEILRDQ